jgi:hypothetical protein
VPAYPQPVLAREFLHLPGPKDLPSPAKPGLRPRGDGVERQARSPERADDRRRAQHARFGFLSKMHGEVLRVLRASKTYDGNQGEPK